MRRLLLSATLCALGPMHLATGAQAQQNVTFLCLAPTGHVCQYAVRSGGQEIAFALPSGERKEAPGVTPHVDKYCVCDPGPVTPDCKAPRLDHWCLGAWADVDAGVNSENEVANRHFAALPESAPVRRVWRGAN